MSALLRLVTALLVILAAPMTALADVPGPEKDDCAAADPVGFVFALVMLGLGLALVRRFGRPKED